MHQACSVVPEDEVAVLDVYDFVIEKVKVADLWNLPKDVFLQTWNTVLTKVYVNFSWFSPSKLLFDAPKIHKGDMLGEVRLKDGSTRGIYYLGDEGIGLREGYFTYRFLGIEFYNGKDIEVQDSYTQTWLFNLGNFDLVLGKHSIQTQVAYAYKDGWNFVVNNVLTFRCDREPVTTCVTVVYDLLNEKLVGFWINSNFMDFYNGTIDVNKDYWMPQLSKNVLRGY